MKAGENGCNCYWRHFNAGLNQLIWTWVGSDDVTGANHKNISFELYPYTYNILQESISQKYFPDN